MRNFFLSVFAMVTVFGIPRLVNEYRGLQLAAKAPPIMVASSAAVGAGQEQAGVKPLPAPVPEIATAPVAVEKPAPMQLLPVTLKPSGIAPAPASPVATLPKNEVELIASIQKELGHLGFYDGLNDGRWNKYVRYAVREFTRRKGNYVRNPKPSLELLASLRDAGLGKVQVKPEAKPEAKPVRQVEFLTSEAPLKKAAPAQEPAPSDDYLPPWIKRNPAGTISDASPAPVIAAPAQARPAQVRTVTRHHRRHRRSWDWDFGW